MRIHIPIDIGTESTYCNFVFSKYSKIVLDYIFALSLIILHRRMFDTCQFDLNI